MHNHSDLGCHPALSPKDLLGIRCKQFWHAAERGDIKTNTARQWKALEAMVAVVVVETEGGGGGVRWWRRRRKSSLSSAVGVTPSAAKAAFAQKPKSSET